MCFLERAFLDFLFPAQFLAPTLCFWFKIVSLPQFYQTLLLNVWFELCVLVNNLNYGCSWLLSISGGAVNLASKFFSSISITFALLIHHILVLWLFQESLFLLILFFTFLYSLGVMLVIYISDLLSNTYDCYAYIYVLVIGIVIL